MFIIFNTLIIYILDCGNNDDEHNCNEHICELNQWQCNSGHCIQLNQHCDGIRKYIYLYLSNWDNF